MKYIILLSMLVGLVLLFSMPTNRLKKFAKIFVFFFFLIFPFIGGYIPSFEILTVNLTAERIFFFGFAFLLVFLFFKMGFKIKVSKVVLWLFIYDAYLILNRSVQSSFVQAEFLYFILPIGFLVLIENLEYTEKDFTIFNNVLTVVALGTFVASFIQLTINPYFYQGVQEGIIDFLEHIRVSASLYRNMSLFTGVGQGHAGTALGCLAMFFMFLNFHKYNFKYAILTGMMSFSVFITFARYVWIIPIIGLMYFLYYKYRKHRFMTFALFGFILILCYVLFFAKLEKTVIYQERIIADTYIGRIITTSIFFKDFFSAKPIFGYGISSWEYEPFRILFGIGIHVGLVNIIFRGGLVALLLFSVFLFQVSKRGMLILKKTGNPVFIVFIVIFLAINMTGGLTNINYYGYYFMFFYLTMSYKLYVGDMKRKS